MPISVGSVEVDIIPSTRGIAARLQRALIPAATRAGEEAGQAAGNAFGPAMQEAVGGAGLRIGQQLGQEIGRQIASQVRDALRSGVTQGGRQAVAPATRSGEETGGAFARAMKARLEAAFRSLPKITIGANTSEADADLQALRVRMESLSSKRIGVDISAEDAKAELDQILAELARVGSSNPDVTVRADTARAQAQLEEVRAEIDRISARPGQVRIDLDGTFATRLRAQLEAAQAGLPHIEVTTDTDRAQAELARLRAEMDSLARAQIGVDIDAAGAQAKIAEIRARLTELARNRSAAIDVRVDAAAAEAQLAQVAAMAEAVDAERPNVHVDASGAMSAVLQLAIALGGLAAIPAIPVLGAGIGALTASLTAATAGVGIFAAAALPAFSDIRNALQGQKAAQDAATNATAKSGQAAAQAATRDNQLAGAQDALANAHRNAAKQIQAAQQGVRQAEQGVAQAAQQAAANNVKAAQDVVAAKRAVADAVEQAAERQKSADGQVVQAERDLAAAQAAARQTQLDLTQARKDAVRQLEDMNNSLADAKLSERDAILGVQQAQQNLNAVLANPKSTQLQRAQAQLTFDQAKQRLVEQEQQVKRLQADTAAANRAGVEGSKTVQSALDAQKKAQQDVVDKTSALADARANDAKVARDNARTIADAQAKLAASQANVAAVQKAGAQSVAAAQEKVAEAQQRVVDAQQQAATSIASAERQVQSARLASAKATDQVAVANSKYQALLAKMTPATRQTYFAFLDLRSAFTAWSRSLQPTIMPIFTRALVGAKAALQSLTPFVLAAARGISALQDRASAGFKSPWWISFKRDLAGSVTPAIIGMGTAFAQVFKGLMGIIQAFLPHIDGINARMLSLTGRFANWGASLKGSPAFESFLAYASRMAPVVSGFLRQLIVMLTQVSTALSPLTGPLLGALGAVASAIGRLATQFPGLIQMLYVLFITAKVARIALVAYGAIMGVVNAVNALATVGWQGLNAAMRANIIILIVTLLAALVFGLIQAYQHVGWFRTAVNAAWAGISTAATFMWNYVLHPVLTAIEVAARAVGVAALWLWNNAIKPAFTFIWTAARVLLVILVVVVLTPIILIIRTLAAVAMWLWTYAIGPAFRLIGALATWLWKNAIKPAFDGIAWVANWLYNNVIKPSFQAMMVQFRMLATVGTWLWKTILKPAFEGIAWIANWLWKNAIKPAFDGIAWAAGWLWDHGLKQVFATIKAQVKLVGEAFSIAVGVIKKVWDTLSGIAKKPVNFIISTVYTHGIKALWDKVAGWVGLGKLPAAPKLLEAGGTVGPGFGPATPMVTNRPTAIVGEGGPHPEYVIPTAPKYRSRALALWQAAGTQLMEGGGILGSIWGGIKGAAGWVGGKAVDVLKAAGKVAAGALRPFFNAGMAVVNTALKHMPGADSGLGKVIAAIPRKVATGILDFLGGKDAESNGGAHVAEALAWARTQAGKPYQWGGTGNPSFDCSGFMGGIQLKIDGKNPNRRIWTTHAFSGKTAPAGWVYHKSSPFQVGVTNAGVGHTAGTLGGHNVESSGGAGVRVDNGARGYNSSLFGSNWYGYVPAIAKGPGGFDAKAVGGAQQAALQMLGEMGWAKDQFGPLKELWQHESGWRWNATNPSSGAYGIPQSLPANKMASAGADWRTNPTTQIKWGLRYIKSVYGNPSMAWSTWQGRSPHWYDDGGWLPQGLSLTANGTGRPEAVLTSGQFRDLATVASSVRGGDGAQLGDVHVYVGDREITDIVRVEVGRADQARARRFTAGRKR